MATKCGTRPRLADYLAGNWLYDSLGSAVFTDPATKAEEPWRKTLGHPLSSKGGQLKPDSALAVCITGGSVYGEGFPVPAWCSMTGGHTKALQTDTGKALTADYLDRLQSFYTDFAKWLDASSPDFLDRLECYNQEDLVEVFGMLDDFKDLQGNVTTDEILLLQDMAEGTVCEYWGSAVLDAKQSGSRSPFLDSYIRAINALDASGVSGHSLYAWLIAPHLVDSRKCVETLWEYDSAMIEMGLPLAGSEAEKAMEEEGIPEGSGMAAVVLTAMQGKAIQQTASGVKKIRRKRRKVRPEPASMAPPPEEEAARITEELQEMQRAAQQENEDLAGQLVEAEKDQYARFLSECAKHSRGPEHSEYLDLYQGGTHVSCPQIVVPFPEEERRNLAAIFGIAGFLVGGPPGALAGGGIGAVLDRRAREAYEEAEAEFYALQAAADDPGGDL